MKRSHRAGGSRWLGALILGALWGCVPPRAEPAPERDRPNIVLLLTDDQRADALGVAGNPIIQTPHLDRLAREGVRFANAYVTTPICMTSRASILTGQYARRHGIHDFRTDLAGAAFERSYPALLRRAGYWTGFIGKYGVGTRMPMDRFDVWDGFGGQGEYEARDAEGRPIHLTRLMGRQAVSFIHGAPADRPFVLSVSFKAPHVQDGDPRQFIPDSAYLSLYRQVSVPPPPATEAGHLRSLPAFLAGDSTEARLRWRLQFATPEMYQNTVRNYYRLVTQVDDVVGEIRAALRERGVEDNTVILFTSDNGYFLGEHGLSHKWYGYEESIRVPLLVYDPRRANRGPPRVRREMALNIDIAPTLLDLAGVPIPAEMQGRSLLPLVRGERVTGWREDFLFEHLFAHPRIPRSDGVVAGRYKYLRYIDQQPVHEQLFDLASDPHETDNRIADPEYAAALARLRARYRVLAAAAGPAPGPDRE